MNKNENEKTEKQNKNSEVILKTDELLQQNEKLNDEDKVKMVCNIDFTQNVEVTENKFFNQLNSLMMDDNFRNFYNEYFKDFTDVKVAILYMKLYETLEVEYKKRNNSDIDRRFLMFIIKEVMAEKTTRKKILESFENYTKNNDNQFLDFFFNEKKIFSRKKSFESII